MLYEAEKFGIQILVLIKFIYSEKATKSCKIFSLILSYVVPVKRKVEISQNFVAFSKCMNFKDLQKLGLKLDWQIEWLKQHHYYK